MSNHIVYSFKCPHPHSQVEKYYGMTQSTLSHRLTAHGQNGSIHEHFLNEHNRKPTRTELTENTSIICRATNRHKLAIKEALLILNHAPSINKQFDNFSNILKIHMNKNGNNYLPLDNTDSTNFNNHPQLNFSSQSNPIANPTQLHNLLSDSESIPDMGKILTYFGINIMELNTVSLNKYNWNTFNIESNSTSNKCNLNNTLNTLTVSQAPVSPITPFSLTISQRIRGMVREARNKINPLNTYTGS